MAIAERLHALRCSKCIEGRVVPVLSMGSGVGADTRDIVALRDGGELGIVDADVRRRRELGKAGPVLRDGPFPDRTYAN